MKLNLYDKSFTHYKQLFFVIPKRFIAYVIFFIQNIRPYFCRRFMYASF